MSRNAPARQPPVEKPDPAVVRRALLAWYDRNARALPWRIGPATKRRKPDPYRVWLSEIMLQQTTVAAVGPYFAKFLALFPSVDRLAAAPRETVLNAWAGLGYYSRARNLHAAAHILARDGFPKTEAGWRALPGVGPYTAAAIAAIALDLPANVVDGNVARVMARLHAVAAPLPGAKPILRDLAAAYVTPERPGDWAQALMDLGATLCVPAAPKCLLCPVRDACAAYAQGAPESFPRKTAKPARPERHGVAFVLTQRDRIWIETRADKGLLGGMSGLPTTPWRDAAWSEPDARDFAPAAGAWRSTGQVRHVFTHFALTLDVWRLALPRSAPKRDGAWRAPDEAGLPTVFRKAVEAAKKAI